MPEHHSIDQDAALVAAHLPMHIQGEPEENCPLCAFIRITTLAREMQQWRYAATHELRPNGDVGEREDGDVAQLLKLAAHGGQV